MPGKNGCYPFLVGHLPGVALFILLCRQKVCYGLMCTNKARQHLYSNSPHLESMDTYDF